MISLDCIWDACSLGPPLSQSLERVSEFWLLGRVDTVCYLYNVLILLFFTNGILISLGIPIVIFPDSFAAIKSNATQF